MTAHPIDTEALRGEIEAAVTDYQWVFPSPLNLAPNLALAVRALSALAAAEHRATRAEAQSEARRINTEYWKEKAVARGISFREARAERDQNLEDLGEAEARIKAARELHQQSALIRRTPRSMRQGHDDDQPFHYCTGYDGARYPCDTIRALDGDT